jgi:hypothetical protein
MRRFRGSILLFVLLVVSLAPLSVRADATPQATPAGSCDFPPISVDLLREMRDEIAANPPPTPTPEANYSSSRSHLMPFPPPPGEPIDEATAESIRSFLSDYAECLRTAPLVSTYGAWTESLIRRVLGSDPETADALIRVAKMETKEPMFVHPEIRNLPLLRAWRIETGHVVAVVQIVDTQNEHQQYWTMLLLPHGDSWRIDDIWSLGPRMIADNLSGPIYATPIPSD